MFFSSLLLSSQPRYVSFLLSFLLYTRNRFAKVSYALTVCETRSQCVPLAPPRAPLTLSLLHSTVLHMLLTLYKCDSYWTISRRAVLYLPIKASTFSFSLCFDYFNKPCTTIVVKKTDTPSFRTPTWLIFFIFFCELRSFFWKRIKKFW